MGSNSSKHIMQWKEKAEDDDDAMIILFVLIYFDCFETTSSPAALRSERHDGDGWDQKVLTTACSGSADSKSDATRSNACGLLMTTITTTAASCPSW